MAESVYTKAIEDVVRAVGRRATWLNEYALCGALGEGLVVKLYERPIEDYNSTGPGFAVVRNSGYRFFLTCKGIDLLQSMNERKGRPEPEPVVPSWDDAPDWAMWKAQDRHGAWYWYENRPAKRDRICTWNRCSGRTLYAGNDNHNHHWRATLQKRPLPEIAPCPHCGRAAELCEKGGYWYVRCESCLATSGSFPKTFTGNKARTVELWNRRSGK